MWEIQISMREIPISMRNSKGKSTTRIYIYITTSSTLSRGGTTNSSVLICFLSKLLPYRKNCNYQVAPLMKNKNNTKDKNAVLVFFAFYNFTLQSPYTGQLAHTGYLNLHPAVHMLMDFSGWLDGDTRTPKTTIQTTISHQNSTLMQQWTVRRALYVRSA